MAKRVTAPRVKCRTCNESLPTYLIESHERQHVDAAYAERINR